MSSPGRHSQAVVHFPDATLTFHDELVIDRTGVRWRMTTRTEYDSVRRVYRLGARLRQGGKAVRGQFVVPEDVVLGLEKDEDLRTFAIREIKKYLDRTNLSDDFSYDLPYRFRV